MTKTVLVFDTECYQNYWLVMFRNIKTGTVKYFEKFEGQVLDDVSIRAILNRYLICGFNSSNYDLPLLFLALAGASNAKLKECNDFIIGENRQPWQCESQFGFKISQKIDHIDLFEVAPGKASLKMYGGRLHTKTIRDLPFDPSAVITPEQHAELREYCGNDLVLTQELYTFLKPQIDLRIEMGKTYGLDLRSKSDAQIAEAVIKKEVERITKNTVEKPVVKERTFKYKKPPFISFETKQLQDVLQTVLDAEFYVSDNGKVDLPEGIKNLKISIGKTSYTMGIGGCHSTEESVAYETRDLESNIGI
jgi:hypothetical protein